VKACDDGTLDDRSEKWQLRREKEKQVQRRANPPCKRGVTPDSAHRTVEKPSHCPGDVINLKDSKTCKELLYITLSSAATFFCVSHMTAL